MTELIIDGIQAVLPQSFTIQVKRENPLITKNGEYTYDVTLDLSNPVNAELYKHLNRLNSVAEVTTKRSAVLIADNRVYCNGTEVITGWTDKTVTIQIASGNSELNYIIGGDREIASLTDMPVTDPSDSPWEHMDATYPDISYCVAPVFDESLGSLCNAWGIKYYDVNPQVSSFNSSYKFAQPFLLPYIKALLEALGYSLMSNALEDTAYKELYICQTAHPMNWCEMLPKWTVTEFLEQVELMFNGIFVIDNRSKQVDFLLRRSFFQGQTSIHVSDIDDVYEVEVDDEPDVEDMADANVSYKMDDSEFWRFHSLSESLRTIASVEHIPASFNPNAIDIYRLTLWFSDSAHQNKNIIYYDDKSGLSAIYKESIHRIRADQPTASLTPVYLLVDDFAPLIREDGKTDIELEIGPATFKITQLPSFPSDSSGRVISDDKIMVPVIMNSNSAANQEKKDLADMIADNSAPSTPSKTRISLSFYNGRNYTIVSFGRDPGPLRYPLSFIDKFTYGIRKGQEGDIRDLTSISDDLHSLKLKTLDISFYQGAYDIDFKHGIKLSSYDPNVYNPRRVFEIRNKRYICAEIEYTLDANGRKGSWTGTFYPIRISDTEADARWILTDGKWRDGGVWLDNGRWLDE